MHIFTIATVLPPSLVLIERLVLSENFGLRSPSACAFTSFIWTAFGGSGGGGGGASPVPPRTPPSTPPSWPPTTPPTTPPSTPPSMPPSTPSSSPSLSSSLGGSSTLIGCTTSAVGFGLISVLVVLVFFLG